MDRPRYRRELIRLANRDRLDPEQVSNMLEYTEYALSIAELEFEFEVPATDESILGLYRVWEKSLHAEP